MAAGSLAQWASPLRRREHSSRVANGIVCRCCRPGCFGAPWASSECPRGPGDSSECPRSPGDSYESLVPQVPLYIPHRNRENL
eukprot:8701856-Pyramimonas_sp.AAC.1